MTELVQTVVNGLLSGAVYALVAVAITLIFGVLGVPHFAVGQVGMVAALTASTLVAAHWFGYWGALAAAAVVGAAIGVGSEWIVFRPLRSRPPVNSFIGAFGLLLVLQTVAQLIWGADIRRLDSGIDGVVTVAGLRLADQRLLVAGCALALIAAMTAFLRYSSGGRAMRAVAENALAAQLAGADVGRVATITLAVGSAMAGLAAVLLAPLTFISATSGFDLAVRAFVIVVVGGMGSIGGALAASLLLGVLENVGAVYISATYATLLSYAVLFLLLAVRPRGLFGRLEVAR